MKRDEYNEGMEQVYIQEQIDSYDKIRKEEKEMKCPVCGNQMVLRWKSSAQEWYCPKCEAVFRKGVWWRRTSDNVQHRGILLPEVRA